jgi:hypothetical protein
MKPPININAMLKIGMVATITIARIMTATPTTTIGMAKENPILFVLMGMVNGIISGYINNY